MKLRFAPSPTGYLHVGNIRSGLINFLHARRHGGRFVLRIDDTDPERSRPEYEAAILQDLRWLGLDWDESFHQSERLDAYAAAAERLKAAGRLYPCFESEEELRAKREARLKRRQPPVYDRAMLKLTPAQRAAAEAGGKRPYWRFRLSDRTIGWNDMVLGRRQVKLASMSDPVLIREDGRPLYGFASVVDDLETGITDVIRGEDHVSNTGMQLDLYDALGGDPGAIRFGHHPLLIGTDGGKLSKRFDSLSLRSLARDGIEAMTVTSYLAALGTSVDPAPLPVAALAERFEIAQVSHSPARFDGEQLLAMNRRVLHGLAFEDVRDRLPAGAGAAFWHAVRGNLDLFSEVRHWWDVVSGSVVVPVQEGEGAFLRDAAERLPAEPWGETVWADWTGALKEATGRKGKALFHPLRLALTGEERGPELRELLPLIGAARARDRLRIATS